MTDKRQPSIWDHHLNPAIPLVAIFGIVAAIGIIAVNCSITVQYSACVAHHTPEECKR